MFVKISAVIFNLVLSLQCVFGTNLEAFGLARFKLYTNQSAQNAEFHYHQSYAVDAPGTPCVMKDGAEGVCTILSKCPFALQEMKQFQFPKFCSFNVLKPMVCCVDCSVLHGDGFYYTFLIDGYGKADDKCLEDYYTSFPCYKLGSIYRNLDESLTCYRNPHQMRHVISGGHNAKRDEYPHMALIGYGDDPDEAQWMCGGTVITNRYILTAAHCISSPALGEIKFAALGILKRTDKPQLWQKYDVIKIIGYPDYRPPSKYHDIALLATGAKIRFNKQVIPACLHRGMDLADVAQATGWGAMGHRKQLADHLQVVTVKKYSDRRCSEAYPAHRHLKGGYNTTTQVCYGDEVEINDTCEGDSGGPLQIKTPGAKKSKCLYTVIGVTSYGRSCGYVGSAGMYTRVAHYIPWIESIAGKLQ